MERRDISQDHPDYTAIRRSANLVMREKGWNFTKALAYVKDDYIRQKEARAKTVTELFAEMGVELDD